MLFRSRRVEEALGIARAAVDEATAKEARRLVEEGVREEADALRALEGKGWRLKTAGRPGAAGGGGSPGGEVPATSARPRARSEAPDITVVPETAASEIDLRGMTADEAEAAVLTAVDAAVVAALPWLRIIHGKGTGVLRTTVQRLLQRDRRVAGFRLAPVPQGGSGVTIVEFHP